MKRRATGKSGRPAEPKKKTTGKKKRMEAPKRKSSPFVEHMAAVSEPSDDDQPIKPPRQSPRPQVESDSESSGGWSENDDVSPVKKTMTVERKTEEKITSTETHSTPQQKLTRVFPRVFQVKRPMDGREIWQIQIFLNTGRVDSIGHFDHRDWHKEVRPFCNFCFDDATVIVCRPSWMMGSSRSSGIKT